MEKKKVLFVKEYQINRLIKIDRKYFLNKNIEKEVERYTINISSK